MEFERFNELHCNGDFKIINTHGTDFTSTHRQPQLIANVKDVPHNCTESTKIVQFIINFHSFSHKWTIKWQQIQSTLSLYSFLFFLF